MRKDFCRVLERSSKVLTLVSVLFMALSLGFTSCADDGITKEEVDQPETPSTPDPAPVVSTVNMLPRLHVDGRYLKNESGEIKNLHGFWQTYSPWFNGDAWGEHSWGDYNVKECLEYNMRQIDKILECGWKVDFMRLHMDSYWSLNTNRAWPPTKEEYEDFNEERFKKYLDEVFVPMVKYCTQKGLYVVLMPGYSAPEVLQYGDEFYDVLTKLWTNISTHPFLKDNMDVMFEIVNEPRSIMAGGVAGGNDDAHNQELTRYMQSFYDLIRKNAKNIIWIPGTGYQSQYAGYAKYPISGKDFGFAVHCYPGWYGSDAEVESAELGGGLDGGGFDAFRNGWEAQISPAAKIAPIMITEMDWAPKKYNKSWGKSYTGEAGGSGFGANFKWLADHEGNVSYILFTAPNDLAEYTGNPGSQTQYLIDPKGCPWQIHHWYEEYRNGNVQPTTASSIKIGGSSKGLNVVVGTEKDVIVNALQEYGVIYPLQNGYTITSDDESIVRVNGTKIVGVSEGKTRITVKALGLETSCDVNVNAVFPLKNGIFDPSIWETGTFDESTGSFTTGKYGFAGWRFSPALDISSHKYLVVKLKSGTNFSVAPSFRLFDKGYWDGAAEYNFNGKLELKIEIAKIKRADGGAFNTKNVTIAGFWTLGGGKIIVDKIYFED